MLWVLLWLLALHRLVPPSQEVLENFLEHVKIDGLELSYLALDLLYIVQEHLELEEFLERDAGVFIGSFELLNYFIDSLQVLVVLALLHHYDGGLEEVLNRNRIILISIISEEIILDQVHLKLFA